MKVSPINYQKNIMVNSEKNINFQGAHFRNFKNHISCKPKQSRRFLKLKLFAPTKKGVSKNIAIIGQNEKLKTLYKMLDIIIEKLQKDTCDLRKNKGYTTPLSDYEMLIR